MVVIEVLNHAYHLGAAILAAVVIFFPNYGVLFAGNTEYFCSSFSGNWMCCRGSTHVLIFFHVQQPLDHFPDWYAFIYLMVEFD